VLSNIYSSKSKVYSEKKLHKLASTAQQKYISYRDSTLNEDLLNAIIITQSEYEKGQHALLIENTSKNQRIQKLVIGVIAFIFFVLSVILVRRIRIKQLINLKLITKVRERTRELETRKIELIKANNEKVSFARKTIQEINSPLASIKGLHNAARLAVKDVSALDYFDQLNKSVETLNHLVKRLSIMNHDSEVHSLESIRLYPLVKKAALESGCQIKFFVKDETLRILAPRDPIYNLLQTLLHFSIQNSAITPAIFLEQTHDLVLLKIVFEPATPLDNNLLSTIRKEIDFVRVGIIQSNTEIGWRGVTAAFKQDVL
jgi:signal transduction histidine kinase